MDDFDEDDEDIGDMVVPTAGVASVYDDVEEDSDDGLISEPLGYSSFLGDSHCPGGGNSNGETIPEEKAASSDEDDDGLVEIMVPGKSKS